MITLITNGMMNNMGKRSVLILFLLALFAAGCTPTASPDPSGQTEQPDNPDTPDNPDNPPTPPGPVTPTPSFALAGGATELVFSCSSNYDNLQTVGEYYDWVVVCESDWLNADKNPGRPPQLHIDMPQYGVDMFNADPKARAREAQVLIYDAEKKQLLFTLTVYQDPLPYLKDGSFKVAPGGGDYLYRPTANVRGWTPSLVLDPGWEQDYDNSWLTAEKTPDGLLKVHVQPWDPDQPKPLPGSITIEAYDSRSFIHPSYYDPTISGEQPGYGEGGPWDD